MAHLSRLSYTLQKRLQDGVKGQECGWVWDEFMEETSVEPRGKGSGLEGRRAVRSSRKEESSSGQPPQSTEETTGVWRFLAGK